MIEPRDYARFERELAALILGKADDPEGFAQAQALLDLGAALMAQRALELREHDGYSWADLARPLGVSRQAVAQRYGPRPLRSAG